MFSLKNRVAWVTGSSTGLGKAMAIEIGKAGAKVALNYANNDARAEATFAEFKAAGGEGILVKGDATSPRTSSADVRADRGRTRSR